MILELDGGFCFEIPALGDARDLFQLYKFFDSVKANNGGKVGGFLTLQLYIF